MKIRFFMLGAENNGSTERFVSEVKHVFSDHLGDDGDVMQFGGIKEATSAIAKAVEDTHALVFIADRSNFGNTKKMLSKAFGFSLSCEKSLLEKACVSKDISAEDADEAFAVTHAHIPENARRFVFDDGLYAGFSVANGNQTIILLPYIKARTSVLLFSQVVPYLNSVYHISIDVSKAKKYNCSVLLDAIREKNVKLAVSATNTAEFLKEYLYTNEELKEYVSFSQIAEKRGSMQPVDYVVNLSIAASELLSCPYGIAMSNAFYTGDTPDCEKVVYLAVTNERETSIREIHSFSGEDIASFLARCSGDLCHFICDVFRNDNEHKDDIENRKKAAVKRYKTAILAVTAIIAAVAVFCVSYFKSHNYTFRQWGTGFTEMIFPAGNPFEGMFDRFVPGQDEIIAGQAQQTQSVTESVQETESTEETHSQEA